MRAPKNTTSKKLPAEYLALKEEASSKFAEVNMLGALVAQGRATQEQKEKAKSELEDLKLKIETMWKEVQVQ